MTGQKGGSMDDLISREKAIDVLYKNYILGRGDLNEVLDHIVDRLEKLPSAQPETHDKRTETHACDLIDRQVAIDALTRKMVSIPTAGEKDLMGDVNRIRAEDISVIKRLPSAQPTLYGYPVEHLAMIARVLQKENFPPERISEILSNVGRIVAMVRDVVRDEFEETLRKAVEQCMMT